GGLSVAVVIVVERKPVTIGVLNEPPVLIAKPVGMLERVVNLDQLRGLAVFVAHEQLRRFVLAMVQPHFADQAVLGSNLDAPARALHYFTQSGCVSDVSQ